MEKLTFLYFFFSIKATEDQTNKNSQMKADWSRLASLQPLHQDAVLTKTHPNCIDSFDIAAKFFFGFTYKK